MPQSTLIMTFVWLYGLAIKQNQAFQSLCKYTESSSTVTDCIGCFLIYPLTSTPVACLHGGSPTITTIQNQFPYKNLPQQLCTDAHISTTDNIVLCQSIQVAQCNHTYNVTQISSHCSWKTWNLASCDSIKGYMMNIYIAAYEHHSYKWDNHK